MKHEERIAQNDSEQLRPCTRERTSPLAVQVEESCEHCGGSGYDWGSLSPMEPDVCPGCHGSGTQIVRRDYLAEALRIAGGRSATVPRREHLQAVIEHCRALVEAVMAMPVVR